MVFGILRGIFRPRGSGKCPVCRVGLEAQDYQQTRVVRCPSCRGAWWDSEEIQGFLAKKVPGSALASLRDLLGDFPLLSGETNSDRVCPRCDHVMRTLALRTPPRLLLEKCQRNCGLWIDPSELQRLEALESPE